MICAWWVLVLLVCVAQQVSQHWKLWYGLQQAKHEV